jgi:adenosylmethionine-8-amino-7-oxononanoate aminotransferase
MNTQDRQIMRLMAWERAKGELISMLQTYVAEQEQYDKLNKAINEFIKDVEDNAKHE